MADTWSALFPYITLDVGKNMGSILNSHAAEVLKIRRIVLINAEWDYAAFVGDDIVEILRYTAASLAGSTAIVPLPYSSANVAPSSATYGYGGVVGGVSERLRSLFITARQPQVDVNGMENWATVVPYGVVFDAGYADSNVQPLALRQDEMVTVLNTLGNAGHLDTWIEFTKE